MRYMKLVCFIAGHMLENDWEGNILFSADSISPTKGTDNLTSRKYARLKELQ